MIKLSILVCSLLERRSTFLNNLLNILEPQLTHQVELIVLADNAKRSIGEKRNDAIEMSNGQYFCFIDDDDRVSDDYVKLILEKTESEPDVIVFNAEITFDGVRPKLVRYGKEFSHCEAPEAYYRRPNHLMVHKRSNVVEKFQPISFGEDDEWAARRLSSIATQEKIDKILYYYDYKTTTKKY
jgi:glycosyltransferase involved in cell wall biosynthesis